MNRMLVWPKADIRESTAQKAIKEMAEALDLYAYGRWNDDYPGGIDLGGSQLDFGSRAIKALKNPHVRRALQAIDGDGDE